MRRGALAIIGLSAALTGAAYANSLHNGFHFDDGHSIEDNRYLRSLANLPAFFTDVATFSPLAENRSYRPVLLVGYALSHQLGAGAPWGYHAGSLLLHALGAAAVGLLLARLARGLDRPDATALGLVAAGTFAVHPLLSETVNYLSARSSMQGAVLAFWTLLLYVAGRQAGSERRRRLAFVAAAAVYALAMLSKITAITVPALVVAYELWLGPARDAVLRDRVKACLQPAGLALAGLALALTLLHERMVGAYARGARSQIEPWSHLLTQTRVWMRYQALFVWPEDLCADLTMAWSESPFEGPTARAILFFGLVVAVAWGLRRRAPLVSFGVLWYYVTLSPTNSFVPLSEPATEHRVYIAAPGLIFALVGLWGLRPRGAPGARRFVAPALASAALAGLLATTVARNRVWKDDVTLWGSVLTCAPDNGRAHLNYGRGLLAQGDRVGARRAYERCAELWPGYSFCYVNLAALDLLEDRVDLADRHAVQARAVAPRNVYVQQWSGKVAFAQERFAEAEAYFARTLEIAPGFADAERDLALARFELGRLDEARAGLAPFARVGRLDASGWFAWGYLEQIAGRPEPAARAYDRALARDAEYDRARYNRAVLRHRAGALADATADYRRLAARPAPGPDVLYNLALALSAQGDPAGARAARDRLRRRAPDYPGLADLARTLGP